MAASTVPKLYRSVIEDVINNVREAFLDEGVDEQILVELKQTWEKKLVESKAVEHKEPEMVSAPNFRHQVTSQSSSQHAQPQPRVVAQVASSAIAHQLALPPGSLVQPIIQYSSTTGTGMETVALTVPQKVTIALPAQNSQQGVQTVMSAGTTLALNPQMTANLLQQAGILSTQQATPTSLDTAVLDKQYTVSLSQATNSAVLQTGRIPQVDGACDTSDEEEEDDFRDNDDDRNDNNDDEQNEDECAAEEEDEPLNSEDDVSDEDPSELFETDNVVVCQFDKISRSRNRWKFHLKDGIMNLSGKDYVFQKAIGDSEW
ncbi:transcription initiation factor IIA subunit 1-like isoform X2 [Limulus polyphemus]|uniref:Transcription initiation factor IIA subunit 1-like isoform X2 n=1 Tax=Limulus polyphemus TaxID=6850 RepID=A0ABM1BTX5_LIMPO|nr:transcription initiation factor IIA subunit 1-like isoform X2 [Limulus polyphemus]